MLRQLTNFGFLAVLLTVGVASIDALADGRGTLSYKNVAIKSVDCPSEEMTKGSLKFVDSDGITHEILVWSDSQHACRELEGLKSGHTVDLSVAYFDWADYTSGMMEDFVLRESLDGLSIDGKSRMAPTEPLTLPFKKVICGDEPEGRKICVLKNGDKFYLEFANASRISIYGAWEERGAIVSFDGVNEDMRVILPTSKNPGVMIDRVLNSNNQKVISSVKAIVR